MPVEAQACGRPVVALREGGALESVDRRRHRRAGRPSASARRRSPTALRRRAPVAPFDAGGNPPARRAIQPRALRRRAIANRDRTTDCRSADRGSAMDKGGYNRLLVAFYVCRDAILGIAAFIARLLLRFETGRSPVTKAYPPFEQYLNIAAVHRRARAVRLSRAGPLPAASRPLARGRLLRRARRQHPRGRLRSSAPRCTSRRTTCSDALKAAAPTRSRRSCGSVPRAQRHVHVRVARAGARGARAPLARRHRAEAHPHRRRRRSRRMVADKSSSTASSASGRRLRRRRAVGDHIGYRGMPLLGTLAEADEISAASASITCTSRCRSKST